MFVITAIVIMLIPGHAAGYAVRVLPDVPRRPLQRGDIYIYICIYREREIHTYIYIYIYIYRERERERTGIY